MSTTDQLFDVPEQLSPRLAWQKRHNIKTTQVEAGVICAWKCRLRDELPGVYNSVTAKTEEEAVTDLAIKMIIPLWNEENP
jgi:hypothetical protein